VTNLLSIVGGIWLVSFLLMTGELARAYAAHRGKIRAFGSSRRSENRKPKPIEPRVQASPLQIPIRDGA
jgi:hypothetical protein